MFDLEEVKSTAKMYFPDIKIKRIVTDLDHKVELALYTDCGQRVYSSFRVSLKESRSKSYMHSRLLNTLEVLSIRLREGGIPWKKTWLRELHWR